MPRRLSLWRMSSTFESVSPSSITRSVPLLTPMAFFSLRSATPAPLWCPFLFSFLPFALSLSLSGLDREQPVELFAAPPAGHIVRCNLPPELARRGKDRLATERSDFAEQSDVRRRRRDSREYQPPLHAFCGAPPASSAESGTKP